MGAKTAYSTKTSIDENVQELKNAFEGFPAKAILFFGSSCFQPELLAEKMKETFAPVPVFGCTTAGEIVSGKMLKNSIVAMGFDEGSVKDLQVEILEKVDETAGVANAFAGFERHFGTPVAQMDPSEYVGLILIDGLCGAEERIMDKIGDLTDLTFIGGSAGDDLGFAKTFVFADGKAYSNAAVLAILRLGKGFDVLKTQSFKVLDKKLMVTRANEKCREVIEFDGLPAAEAYAKALGVSVDDAGNSFMTYPVGLMVGDEPFVRSPQQVKDDKAMVFYCSILDGMEVSLLESTDIIADTKAALDKKIKELGDVSGIINFHCILRTLELEKKGQTEQYGEIFSSVPAIGFSTYGEEYIGHINQTSTMLFIK